NATSTSEPAPPPLPLAPGAKKKKDAKTPTPTPPLAVATGPSIALPDLHALRDRATKAAATLAAKLSADAQVNVASLLVHHISLGSKVPELTLGPAKITALRHEKTIDVSFATAPSARGTSLKLDAQVPLEQGDLRVAFDGGPLTLAELGAHEGAGGLADVDRATLTAKGSAVLAGDASNLTVDAQFAVADLGIAHPKVSDETVHGIAASMLLKAGLTDKGTLTIDDAEGALGALRLRFRGSVVDANDHLEGSLVFDAPVAACQSLLESIPAGLIPDVRETEITGTLGASGRLVFDTRDFDDLDLAYVVDDKCKFVRVADDFERDRFNHPFSHTVYLPDGSTAEEETGPGSDAWADLERISPYMQVAVLTTEDGGFYKHHGFNRSAIRNALVADLKAGRFLRGASTISMQTSKNLFLSRQKTVSRKLEELILTDYLEQTFSKHEIMDLYLNIIEFGPDIYGIKAAADHYFGRGPEDLNFAEALFLSSLLPNPIGYHKLWEKGQISPSWAKNIKTLMGLSFKYGKITKEQLDQGLAEDVIFFKEDPNHPELRPTPRPMPTGVKISGDDEAYEQPFTPTDSF
ncbi:MAG TPA: transglycosylase domain-containing protein, partial [Polyangiaceae bacterium]